MADDFNPDQFLEDTKNFDPDAFLSHGKSVSGAPSLLSRAISPITSYPETYSQMNREAREQFGHGIGQLSSPSGVTDIAKGAGNVALGGLGYLTSPLSAAYRSVIGKPVEDVTGIPKEYTEFAASLATPGLGLPRIPRAMPKAPVAPPSQLGVVLSEGQRSGELPLIQREQAALRNQLGTPAHEAAQAFREQQEAQLQAAREGVGRGLDPYGGVVADSPYQAGDIAGRGVRQAAGIAKNDVTAAYDVAKAMPGEIHAGAFEGIAQRIKGDLSLRDDPIIVDEKTTPFANQALQDIEQTIDRLKIPNRADPFAPSSSENIVGVNLRGVEQVRKRLTTFRKQAWKSGNDTDGMATSSIVDAFDRRVDAAIDGGLFNGDPRAVQAWKDARSAHADYKSTFGGQPKDAVGNVVQKVLGRRANEPASANAVADYLYGSVGVNPSDLNLGVAKRFKQILGERSPEWSGVKQGLWSRLVDPGADLAQWGPKKTADRINKFLNSDGKDMAAAVYSPTDRKVMQDYADLLRKLEVPQSGANWSNTGAANLFKAIGSKLGMIIGFGAGSTIAHAMHVPPLLGEAVGVATAAAGKHLQEVNEARRVAAQMPVLSQQLQQWSKAVSKANQQPAPLYQRAARSAAVTLDGTLRKFGTSLQELQSPAVGHADENQVDRPPSQQKHGGAVGDQHGFAHGGNVARHKDRAPVYGARRGHDGHWYVRDGHRPGKWLKVNRRAG